MTDLALAADTWRVESLRLAELLARSDSLLETCRAAVRAYLASELDEDADRGKVHLRSVGVIARLAIDLGVEAPGPDGSTACEDGQGVTDGRPGRDGMTHHH